MKLGVSTYSLVRAIRSGEMSVLDVIQWIAAQGGEHVEIVPLGFELIGNDALIQAVREKAETVGIAISSYCIGADFVKEGEAYEAEIERVQREVDVVHALGAKLMRFDVAGWRPPTDRCTIMDFERDLPKMVEACRRVADYAAQFGITTTVENHGYYVNGSDRVIRLIEGVDRPHYRMTLDTGNFWCVDEDPVVAVKKCAQYAAMVHLKDFYHRRVRRFAVELAGSRGPDASHTPPGWFPTSSGNLLRGAIVGDGDIDLLESIAAIKKSGYDGYVSIEFEGHEECKEGTKIGLDNARRMWQAV